MIVKIKDRDSERKFDCGDVDGYVVNIDNNDDSGVNINTDDDAKNGDDSKDDIDFEDG